MDEDRKAYLLRLAEKGPQPDEPSHENPQAFRTDTPRKREPDEIHDLSAWKDEDGKVRRYDLEEQEQHRRDETLDAAYNRRQEERAEAAEQEVADAEQAVRQDEEQWRDHVSKTRTISDPDEIARLQNYTAGWQNVQARMVEFERRKPDLVRQVTALQEAGQHEAAKAIYERAQAEHTALAAERDQFIAGARQWEAHAAQKNLQSRQLQMFRLCPGLQHPHVREEFIRWIEQTHRIPRELIEAEQDPRIVAKVFQQFAHHKGERYLETARKEVAKHAIASRGRGSETSSAEARKALKKSGSMTDALNMIKLKRVEKRHGIP